MPRSDFDAAAYLQELLAGLPPEEAEATKKALTKDEVRDRLADTVLHQKDYRRQTAELRKKEEELAKKNQEVTAFYERQLAIVQENQKFVDDLQKRAAAAEAAAQAYKGQFGDLEGVNVPKPPQEPQKDYLTRDEVQKILEKVQLDGLDVMSKMSSLAGRHYAEFKEPLDTKALSKSAMDQHVDLESAYDRMVAERREEVRAAQVAEQVKAAREEGRREALSNMKYPVVPQPTEQTPLRIRETMTPEQAATPAWKRGVEDFLAGKLGAPAP